jgi:hypothetical protein
MSRSPAGTRKMSPSLIVRLVVSAAQPSILPLVIASKMATCVTVPQLPPAAAANSMAALLVQLVGLVPDTVIVPVTLRAYALPVTSVPPPVSLGAAVNKPTYQAVGRVAVSVVNRNLRVKFSA